MPAVPLPAAPPPAGARRAAAADRAAASDPSVPPGPPCPSPRAQAAPAGPPPAPGSAPKAVHSAPPDPRPPPASSGPRPAADRALAPSPGGGRAKARKRTARGGGADASDRCFRATASGAGGAEKSRAAAPASAEPGANGSSSTPPEHTPDTVREPWYPGAAAPRADEGRDCNEPAAVVAMPALANGRQSDGGAAHAGRRTGGAAPPPPPDAGRRRDAAAPVWPRLTDVSAAPADGGRSLAEGGRTDGGGSPPPRSPPDMADDPATGSPGRAAPPSSRRVRRAEPGRLRLLPEAAPDPSPPGLDTRSSRAREAAAGTPAAWRAEPERGRGAVVAEVAVGSGSGWIICGGGHGEEGAADTGRAGRAAMRSGPPSGSAVTTGTPASNPSTRSARPEGGRRAGPGLPRRAIAAADAARAAPRRAAAREPVIPRSRPLPSRSTARSLMTPETTFLRNDGGATVETTSAPGEEVATAVVVSVRPPIPFTAPP